jgi:hypothetical protein
VHLHVTDPAGAVGYCKDYDAALAIVSTGPSTARVSARTSDVNESDLAAALDPAACKVSHGAPGYAKQVATVSVTVTYDLYPKPDGTLRGDATVKVAGWGVQSCERRYSVSGTKPK